MENKTELIDISGKPVAEIQDLINISISTNNTDGFLLVSQNSITTSTIEIVILSFTKIIIPTFPTPQQ